jgi:hypothetical protein
MYESIHLVRPWGHPEAQRVWRVPLLRQADAALAAIEAAGWRVVPEVPTEAMVDVAFNAPWGVYSTIEQERDGIRREWAVMLAAAPKP